MTLAFALLVLQPPALLGWVYLLLGRDGFWRPQPRIEEERTIRPAVWPEVVAVVPARNEAAHVGPALGSLLEQDYAGRLTLVLVDDHSEDATRAIGERLQAATPAGRRLEVVAAPPLPPGWTGKLWAMAEGLRRAAELAPGARYVLFTDADIRHDPGNLARLVAKAEATGLDLASLMVRLSCRSLFERLLIPPFVLFFQMLYPFAAVNDPRRPTAAAAGGCMLVRRTALAQAGGLEAISHRLIDDVALAGAIKHRPGGGRIWLGLTTNTESLRAYDSLGEIWRMVARSADAQLRHSLLLLVGTVLAMTWAYLLPPLAALRMALHGEPARAALGALACVLMAVAYLPTLRAYRLRLGWLAALPAAVGLLLAMTVDSAIRHRCGRGGLWKGRVTRA